MPVALPLFGFQWTEGVVNMSGDNDIWEQGGIPV